MNLEMKMEQKLLKRLGSGLILLEKDRGLVFRRKQPLIKKASVEARLPYVKKFHQYLLYTAFNEEP